MLIRYLNRPQYEHHAMLFVMLAGSSIGWCASGLFDIVLVAYRKDLSVLGSHIAGAAIALGASLLLVRMFGVNGAAAASLLSSWSVASIKAYVGLRTMRQDERNLKSKSLSMAFTK
jgi:O-antigen/teichoic acid export membrane protein